jgi:hypothetical protein
MKPNALLWHLDRLCTFADMESRDFSRRPSLSICLSREL